MVVIGSPFDLCGYRQGARLGPPAVRLAGLQGTLEGLGHNVVDEGDIAFSDLPTDPAGLKHFEGCVHNLAQVRDRVASAAAKGETPLVIGGDHTLGLGTLAGALKHYGDDVAILWIDAHADCNTPATSPSGNLHGMPLAAAMGRPSGTGGVKDEQWKTLEQRVMPGRYIRPDRLAWFGLRDVDEGEKRVLTSLKGNYVATMYDIDRNGIMQNLQRLHHWIVDSGISKLWISFDVDVLDPILAPGTGTAVRGGLSYREMHLIGELLWECLSEKKYQLAGLDVVETNPLFDNNNATARTAVEWIASLFGKSILGKH